MAKLGIYLLLVIGLALLPVYLINRETPSITRKKALLLTKNHGKFTGIMLKHFWPLHAASTILTSSALIILIEYWRENSIILNALLILCCSILVIFSGVLLSMPAFVIAKHWKEKSQK